MGNVSALDARTGDLVWKREDLRYGSGMTVTPRGVLMTVLGGIILLNHQTGKTIWFQDSYSSTAETLANDNRGILVEGFEIRVFDMGTGRTVWSYNASNQFTRQPTVVDGYIIASNLNGYLYVFRKAEPKDVDENGFPTVTPTTLMLLGITLVLTGSIIQRIKKKRNQG